MLHRGRREHSRSSAKPGTGLANEADRPPSRPSKVKFRAQFAEVSVVARPQLPEGFLGWRKLAFADGRQDTAVSQVFCSPDEVEDCQYLAQVAWSDGRRTVARQVWVEDSADGVSGLLVGGDLGLRLFPAG